MRFLLNENVARTVIEKRRERGHDVLAAKESMRGQSDDVVLRRAQLEQRIVITHDKDFGELAFKSQLSASSGIVLFRLNGSHPEADNRRIIDVLVSRTDWAGHFSVVTDSKIRMRPSSNYPPAASPTPKKRKK